MTKTTPTKEITKEARGGIKKTLKGFVVSDKMDKTVVVNVTRYIAHKKYGKYFKIDKKYKAHDEANAYKTGDKVIIAETKPISKDKAFVVTGKADN